MCIKGIAIVKPNVENGKPHCHLHHASVNTNSSAVVFSRISLLTSDEEVHVHTPDEVIIWTQRHYNKNVTMCKCTVEKSDHFSDMI